MTMNHQVIFYFKISMWVAFHKEIFSLLNMLTWSGMNWGLWSHWTPLIMVKVAVFSPGVSQHIHKNNKSVKTWDSICLWSCKKTLKKLYETGLRCSVYKEAGHVLHEYNKMFQAFCKICQFHLVLQPMDDCSILTQLQSFLPLVRILCTIEPTKCRKQISKGNVHRRWKSHSNKTLIKISSSIKHAARKKKKRCS